METVDSTDMRTMNSSLLLRMIWQKQQISRADISRITGMSRSTVSAIVAELMDRGLVTEQGIGHSNGGRRPVILTLNADAYSILGVDIGANHISVVLTNLKGAIRSSAIRSCPVTADPRSAIESVLDMIHTMKTNAEASGSPLIGIGVGLPCPVTPDETANPMNRDVLPAWEGYNLRSILQDRFDLPILFANDANLGALAELWWGNDEGARNLAFIKWSKGLGAGLIIDGRIHRGSRGLAGELGHFFQQTTATAVQGNLNDTLGSDSILKRFVEQGAKYPQSLLHGATPSTRRFIEALHAKDQAAEEILDELAFQLGLAIVNLLSLLDLDTIVLGGKLYHAGDLLISRVAKVIREKSVWARDVELRWSELGENQIAIGAATMILETALGDLSNFPRPLIPHAHNLAEAQVMLS